MLLGVAGCLLPYSTLSNKDANYIRLRFDKSYHIQSVFMSILQRELICERLGLAHDVTSDEMNTKLMSALGDDSRQYSCIKE